MSFSIAIESDSQIVTFAITRPMSAHELAEAFDGLYDIPGFSEGMNAIWDLSALDLSKVPVAEVRQLPQVLAGRLQRRGTGYKAALVVPGALGYQLVRAYLQILNLIGEIHIRVFRTMREARDWVMPRGPGLQ